MKTINDVLTESIEKIVGDYDIEQKKILWATSICSDESNHNDELLSMSRSWFHLGGLAGYPYAGVTGVNAFIDHVPDDGAAIIIYGPHIGSYNNEKGFMIRPFQNRKSPTCGALCGVYNQMQIKGDQGDHSHDHQFGLISDIISAKLIKKEINSIDILTYKVYEIINGEVHTILSESNLKNYSFPVFLIGGIIINGEKCNYFDFKCFEKVSVVNNNITFSKI